VQLTSKVVGLTLDSKVFKNKCNDNNNNALKLQTELQYVFLQHTL